MSNDHKKGSASNPAIAAAVIAALASIVVAMINRGCIDVGQGSASKSPSGPESVRIPVSEKPPAATPGSQGPWSVFVRNGCDFAVRIDVQYTNASWSDANSGWITVGKHEERVLVEDDGPVMSASHVVYLYVESSDMQTLVHGTHDVEVAGRTIGMDQAVLPLNDGELDYSLCE